MCTKERKPAPYQHEKQAQGPSTLVDVDYGQIQQFLH